MPVVVRAGVRFLDVTGVDENAGTFDATVDVRLRWHEAPGAPVTARGEAVEAALAGRWSPDVALANLQGDPAFRERGLVVGAHGEVELLERTQGTFAAAFDARAFPFDRQVLPVDLVVRGDDIEHVNLEFHGDDVAFSRVSPGLGLVGWTPGIVDLSAAPVGGWYNQHHARVVAGLHVRRSWITSVAPVFIPLLSSMLIPLIAVSLQQVNEDGEFEVDAFELANIVIGGLFAVIALNFTVNSSYATLALGDNTVTRLFGLNYLTLATAMVIDIALFRYKVVARWCGKYVQEQLYFVLSWAIPTLSLACGSAFVLVAWF